MRRRLGPRLTQVTKSEDGHLHDKEEALGRNQHCPHLDLAPPVSRTLRIMSSVYAAPSVVFCLAAKLMRTLTQADEGWGGGVTWLQVLLEPQGGDTGSAGGEDLHPRLPCQAPQAGWRAVLSWAPGLCTVVTHSTDINDPLPPQLSTRRPATCPPPSINLSHETLPKLSSEVLQGGRS